MRAVFSLIARLCHGITLLALFALVGVTAVDVAGRVLFNSPLGFAYELAGVLLGIAVFAGLVNTNWRRDHICIDLADGFINMRPSLDKWSNRFVWFLELGFTLLLALLMARQTLTLKNYQETFMFLPTQKWIPVAIITAFVFISLGAFAAHLYNRNTKPGEHN